MRRRHRLGTAPTDAGIDKCGVNVSAIPVLEPGHRILSVGDLGIGGAAPKDFVVFPKRGGYTKAYVAKKPSKSHPGIRECATEYLIARIGRALPLRVADARLVRLPVRRNEPDDVRFMSRYFLRPGEQSLIHGVELVAQAFEVEKHEVAKAAKATTHESQFYTADMIDEVLRELSDSVATHERLREGFARMMAFDALIGANDRHAENWGVIEDVRTSRFVRFAPIYDTARGLLLWLPDETLRGWFERGRARKELEGHARKSVSLIGTGRHERPNHFEVFEHMVADRRFRCHLAHVVHAFGPRVLHDILCNEFYNLFSRVRLRAVWDLLLFRHAVLIEACKNSRQRTG